MIKFDWCLFDKARDEAHEKETRIAACGTNPGANFVVNLVVCFVALMNESETRSPDLQVRFATATHRRGHFRVRRPGAALGSRRLDAGWIACIC